MYYAMACDRVIPACFSDPAGLSRTPSNAIMLQRLWASVLILSGTFERLVMYSGVVLAIFSALAVASVMVLRRQNPELARPYRVPLYPFVPLCYVGLSITIAVYGLLERPIEAGLRVATRPGRSAALCPLDTGARPAAELTLYGGSANSD